MYLPEDLKGTDWKCEGDPFGAGPDVAVPHERLISLAGILCMRKLAEAIF
jgi:hypothetical protein